MKLLKNIEQLESLIKTLFPEQDSGARSSVSEVLSVQDNGQWDLCKGNAARKLTNSSKLLSDIPEDSSKIKLPDDLPEDQQVGEVQIQPARSNPSLTPTDSMNFDDVDFNVEAELDKLGRYSKRDIAKRTAKRDKRVRQAVHQAHLQKPKISEEQLRENRLQRRSHRRYAAALNEKNLINELNLDHTPLAEGIGATQALKQLKNDTMLGRIKEGVSRINTKLKDLVAPEQRTWQDDPQHWTDAMNTLRHVRQHIMAAHKDRMAGAPKEQYMPHVEAAKQKLANLKATTNEPENFNDLLEDSVHRIGALQKMSNPKVKDPHTGKDTSLYDEAANARRKENNVAVNEELPQSMRTHKKYGIHGVEDTPSKQTAKLRRKSSKVRLLKPNEKGELVQVAELPKSGIKKEEEPTS